jgi:hypothetical protein
VPDGEEVIQGEVTLLLRGFNVYDAIAGMGMYPIITTAIGGNTDTLWDSNGFSIDIDGDMRVNMKGDVHVTVTGDSVGDWIGCVTVQQRLDTPKYEADYAEQ